MGTQAVSVYQQVIEKTKGLSFRSQMLAMNLEKKLGIKDTVSNSSSYFSLQSWTIPSLAKTSHPIPSKLANQLRHLTINPYG